MKKYIAFKLAPSSDWCKIPVPYEITNKDAEAKVTEYAGRTPYNWVLMDEPVHIECKRIIYSFDEAIFNMETHCRRLAVDAINQMTEPQLRKLFNITIVPHNTGEKMIVADLTI